MSLLKMLFGRFFPSRTVEPVYSERVSALVAQIETQARPCVRLVPGEAGNSRLGGTPDMRDAWPRFDGRPMCFLAQLDLAAIRKAGGPDWLPEDGCLLFFYELEHGGWGFDPKDAGSFAVLHEPNGAPASPAPDDLAEDARLPRYPVTFEKGVSFPNMERFGAYGMDLSDEEDAALEAALEAHDPPYPTHQVEGYPGPIQNDQMEEQCQLVTGGLYLGKPEGYYSERAAELKTMPANWRLLFQLDSDDAADMMWGDLGRLYFWIREEDARAGDFSKAWMILQCS